MTAHSVTEALPLRSQAEGTTGTSVPALSCAPPTSTVPAPSESCSEVRAWVLVDRKRYVEFGLSLKISS